MSNGARTVQCLDADSIPLRLLDKLHKVVYYGMGKSSKEADAHVRPKQ